MRYAFSFVLPSQSSAPAWLPAKSLLTTLWPTVKVSSSRPPGANSMAAPSGVPSVQSAGGGAAAGAVAAPNVRVKARNQPAEQDVFVVIVLIEPVVYRTRREPVYLRARRLRKHQPSAAPAITSRNATSASNATLAAARPRDTAGATADVSGAGGWKVTRRE